MPPTSTVPVAAGACAGCACAAASCGSRRSTAAFVRQRIRITSSLSQQRLAGRRIGAVHHLVTVRTSAGKDLVGVLRVVQDEPVIDGWRMPRRHVTSLTQKWLLAHQHAVVVRTMWIVTRDTALADRCVFPEIRSPLVGVAARTALVDGGACLQQLDVRAAVHVVTRGAGERSFPHRHVIEAMLLVRDVAMTAGALLRHGARLELRWSLRGVYAVARGAAEVALIVLTAVPQRV